MQTPGMKVGALRDASFAPVEVFSIGVTDD